MTDQKKRKNNIIISIFLILFVIQFPFSVNAIECKKYDIKCKSKKQINQTKDKIIEKLPKKK